eukprot:TRINITY_DN1812_c0_g1_i3.p1 TRINITY_DN1812_c0_g1~~TRINITY_DN1812_c0_g1_i3.p1  ORF type:complete len:215 (+),score=21.13 TRINITY_DN1812_c0_g1_i3:102-746(+)
METLFSILLHDEYHVTPFGDQGQKTPTKKDAVPTSHSPDATTGYMSSNSTLDESIELKHGFERDRPHPFDTANSERKQRRKQTDETKFKTELCKNWDEKGYCNYGKKCKFAHGKDDLITKPKEVAPGYKSRLCMSFHGKMYCLYGKRCSFVHSTIPIEQRNSRFQYQKLLQFPDLQNTNTTHSRRLPFLCALTRDSSQQWAQDTVDTQVPKAII